MTLTLPQAGRPPRRAWPALLAFLAAAAPLPGQGSPAPRLPFGVGESLVYDVRFGFLNVGTGRMELIALDTVRSRPAWHVRLEIEGGIPGFRVHYVLQSWIDVATFSSLRFTSEANERGRRRRDEYDIYPERGTFIEVVHAYDEQAHTWSQVRQTEQPASPAPLDQASFLFFARTEELTPGAVLTYDRYFKPDRNPVQLAVLRRDTTRVPAGTFPTILVRPVFKARGIFSQDGRAEVWFSDDDRRMMIRMETSLPFGTVSLLLREYQGGYR